MRGLEPGYAFRRSGGRIPQSLPRGRFGGGGGFGSFTCPQPGQAITRPLSTSRPHTRIDGGGVLDRHRGRSCPGARPGGQPPCEQVRILNPLIIMFRCLSLYTKHTLYTHLCSRAAWPWPRGLFTLSARLVDGAGAGRCRMPGAVSDQVLAGRRAGRGWGPRSTAGAWFGILADLILADPARGVRLSRHST